MDPLAPHLVMGVKNFPLAYLASPYSPVRRGLHVTHFVHCTDNEVKSMRCDEAVKAAKWLMENHKLNVFSPIIHSHALHLAGMQGDWGFWQKIDTDFLFVSDMLIVLTIPGWKESTGVQAEIEIAKRFDLDIWYVKISKDGKYQLRKRP